MLKRRDALSILFISITNYRKPPNRDLFIIKASLVKHFCNVQYLCKIHQPNIIKEKKKYAHLTVTVALSTLL